MEPIPAQVPSSIGNITITLYDLTIKPDGDPAQQGRFRIQVLDQNEQPVRQWARQGNLVPYLDDASTFLTTADRTFLIDLLNRIRQEAEARILP